MKKICLYCETPFETEEEKKIFCRPSCHKAFLLMRKSASYPKSNENVESFLFRKIESKHLINAVKILKRSEDLWILSHSMFWHTQDFHEGEIIRFKLQIALWFENGIDVDQTFTELVERSCLAKRQSEEREMQYIPQPEEWFNPECTRGLCSTNKYYKALQKQRQHSPDFNVGLKVFAQAIMCYADTRNILDIIFYRHEFILLTHYDLLQWYMNAIMHYQFIDF